MKIIFGLSLFLILSFSVTERPDIFGEYKLCSSKSPKNCGDQIHLLKDSSFYYSYCVADAFVFQKSIMGKFHLNKDTVELSIEKVFQYYDEGEIKVFLKDISKKKQREDKRTFWKKESWKRLKYFELNGEKIDAFYAERNRLKPKYLLKEREKGLTLISLDSVPIESNLEYSTLYCKMNKPSK